MIRVVAQFLDIDEASIVSVYYKLSYSCCDMYSLSSLVEFLRDDSRSKSTRLILVESVSRMQVLAMENVRSGGQVVQWVAFVLSSDAVFDLNRIRLGCIGIVAARLLYQSKPKLGHKDIIVARKEAQSLF